MSKENLLGIFYRGVQNEIRRALDTASYGSFASLDVDQAERLIENLAQSDACFGNDYDRGSRKQIASVDEAKSMADLKKELSDELNVKMCERMEKMGRVMANNNKPTPQAPNSPSFYQDQPQSYGYWDQHGNWQYGFQDGCQGSYQEGYGQEANENESYNAREEVSYVGNQGSYNFRPFNQHPNLSYRNPNVENPQDLSQNQAPNQPNPTRPNFYPNQTQNRTFNPSQNQPFNPRPQQGNFQPRPQGNFNQFPFQNFNQNRPNFPNQQQWNYPRGNNFQGGNFQGYYQNPQGGSSTTNEQEVIELRAANKALNEKLERLLEAQNASSSKKPNSFPSKPEPNPKEFCKAITLRSGKELLPNQKGEDKDTIENEEDQNVQKGEEEKIEVVEPKAKGKDGVLDKAKEVLFEPPPYQPKLPFPQRLKSQLLAKQRQRFIDIMDKVVVTLPLREAIENSPTWSKFFKDMLTKKKKMEEGFVCVNYECSSIIQHSIPRKLKDPGSFTLPCSIGEMVFNRCLCDLGSSVNLMPLSIATKLGLTNFSPSKISLVLADRSIRYPRGLIEDLPLKLGKYQVPTDFVVLEMDEEPVDPLILGRPFLATAGALIDVRGKKIGLQLGEKIVEFDLQAIMKQPTIGGQLFSIDCSDILEGDMEEEILMDDPLEVALVVEKNEHGYLDQDSSGYEKLLDDCESMVQVGFLQLERDGLLEREEVFKVGEKQTDPWSELNAPKLGLKPLQNGLRYAFLGPNSTYPVIINNALHNDEESMLLNELRKYRKAIG